ncbi:MAG: AsmA family protein [Elusimicrobia bacterium]|nr:AsmA family protein [Elusimicrobiota bacterium]
MRKLVKFFLYFAGFFVLVLLCLFIFLKVYFTSEKIKKIAVDYASRKLKREISIESASLRLTGFVFKNLKISEYPDFKKGNFVSARELRVIPSWKDILRKKVKIDSVKISGLHFNLIQAKENVFNFSDILPAAEAARPPEEKQEKIPVEFVISNFELKDSSVKYKNLQNLIEVSFNSLSFASKNISLTKNFSFNTAFTLEVKSKYLNGKFPVSMLGSLNMAGGKIEEAEAVLKKTEAGFGKIKCRLEGSFKNLLEPDAKATLTVEPFNTTSLKEFFPAVPGKTPMPGIKIDSNFKLTAKSVSFRRSTFKAGPANGRFSGMIVWNPAFNYDLNAEINGNFPEMDSTHIGKRVPAVPKNLKIPSFSASARARLTPSFMIVNPVKINLRETAISLDTKLNFAGQGMKASGTVNMDRARISELAGILPAAKDFNPDGILRGSFKYSYDKKASISGAADFTDVKFACFNHSFSNLSGSLTVSDDALHLNQKTGKLNNENFSSSVSVKNYLPLVPPFGGTDNAALFRKHLDINFNLNLAKFELKEFPKPAQEQKTAGTDKDKPGKKADESKGGNSFIDLSGKSRIGAISLPNFTGNNAVMTYNLKNISADLKNLYGNASFEIKEGRLTNLYELAQKFKIAKVALYPVILLQKASKTAKSKFLPDFDNINYSLIEGAYAFSEGLMKIDKSVLNSEMAIVNSSGNINLPTENLDLKINTTLLKASGISMSAPVGMYVKGTFSNPSVKLDVKSVIEQPAVKKTIVQGLEKLLERLKK